MNMTTFGLVLAIVSFAVAMWQLKQAQDQNLELRRVQNSLSTRYLNQFPFYMPEIADLLEKAIGEIVIVCDYPAFGFFSNSKDWLRYRYVIEKNLQNGVSISMTFFDEEKRDVFRDDFLGAWKNWEEWKCQPSNKANLMNFLKFQPTDKSFDQLSATDFRELLEKEHEKTIKDHFAGAEIHEVHSDITIYCWIVDGKEAIFAIPAISESGEGFATHGFFTSDPRLIGTLSSLPDRYILWSKKNAR